MQNYSVLMSVYYMEKPQFLKEAIESMLNQSVSANDFVLVCDGPLTDELNAVISGFSDSYPELFNVVRLEKNSGLGNALNVGLKECKNELVARMDSDDISLADRIEQQLSVIEEKPENSVIGGQIAEFAENVNNIVAYRNVPLKMEDIKSKLASRNPMNHVTTLFRKSDVEAVGSYEDYPGFEDYQLWAKMLKSGKQFFNIDRLLCFVRVDNNMYSRRGGMKYFEHTKRFFKFMKNENIISEAQYVKNMTVRFCGSVLISAKFREALYGKFLRDKGST